MQPIEIIIIVAAVLIVAGSVALGVYRKKKGKSSCGCKCSSCPYECDKKK